MASDFNTSKVVKLQEALKVQLKKLIQQAIIEGASKEDVDKKAKEIINQFLQENKDVKLKYKDLYQLWSKILYGNFQQMYKISINSLKKELKKDVQSKEINESIKEVYKSDKVKKQSYVFKTKDIDVNNINASDTPNLKFIRTSAEYGYTQMQIDNYVEKVERAMDKIAQLNFVAVNSQGARISLRNKAEMEVRYQDMLSDLKELKNEQFVVVSQHRDSSLRCACWQGLIYLKDTDGTDVSLKNWHEWNNVNNHITPKPIGYTENNQPYYSLKEAMEHGLFSYNCRHRFIKYEPGAKVPKQYPYNPNKESTSSLIDKEMRQMEQNIRRAKERQTLALTPKERKKWQVKSKKLQAQYDEFCKKHNRVRNDWRTSIGIVERGHMKNVENKTEAPYIKPKYDESGVFNAKTIKLVEGIEKQISKFLDRGYSKKDLKEAKLYKNIPEDLKTNFENLLEGIVGNTNANGDGLKNATLYFGKGDKSKNREGSAEHILTDHIDQIDYKFIIHLNATIKNNHFTEVTTSNGNERHESIYEFKNDEGKKRYFIIIADKDEKSDLRIVTAFIRNKLKKK